MFGSFIYYGLFSALPILLASVFLYHRMKQNAIVKKISPLLFVLQSYAIHSLCAILYLALVPLNILDPDTQGVLFFFVYSAAFFVARKHLPGPKNLLLYILPNAIYSVILLAFWIRSAVVYGFDGSVGWLSYAMNALPFGMAFSGVLTSPTTGFLHAITAIMPLLAGFVGAGGADFVAEQKELKSTK